MQENTVGREILLRNHCLDFAFRNITDKRLFYNYERNLK